MVGVLICEPQQPKSEKPTSSNSTTRMFGAPAGGFVASGHQGFEPVMVLPILPPNGGLAPALMLILPAANASAVGPPLARPASPPRAGLPRIIIRIMIMNIRRCKRGCGV